MNYEGEIFKKKLKTATGISPGNRFKQTQLLSLN
jgi:hypothetical protein